MSHTFSIYLYSFLYIHHKHLVAFGNFVNKAISSLLGFHTQFHTHIQKIQEISLFLIWFEFALNFFKSFLYCPENVPKKNLTLFQFHAILILKIFTDDIYETEKKSLYTAGRSRLSVLCRRRQVTKLIYTQTLIWMWRWRWRRRRRLIRIR